MCARAASTTCSSASPASVCPTWATASSRRSTGRFVLGADDQREREEIIERFGLTEASAKIVRHRLTGPRRDGAPFLAIFRAEQAKYEQFLVNSLGPIELWALSTTPGDTSLRNRLYERVGFSEGLRRLSKVFPNGSAMDEIERRTKARLKKGDCRGSRRGRAWSTNSPTS